MTGPHALGILLLSTAPVQEARRLRSPAPLHDGTIQTISPAPALRESKCTEFRRRRTHDDDHRIRTSSR